MAKVNICGRNPCAKASPTVSSVCPWSCQNSSRILLTGKYVGLFGDFSNYWIVDALSMQIQRLSELYAETNQVGFIGRLETDGAPVLEEAFVRVRLA